MTRSLWERAAGGLIRDARLRAGITQHQLAVRAETSQAAIAAYESGARQPTLPTLYRVIAAAGFEPRIRLEALDPHDDTVAAWEASRPAEERRRWRAQQQRFAGTA